jgi:hypothetical protein
MKKTFLQIIRAFYPPLIVYVFQYLAQIFGNIYFRYKHFDGPMHFLGGVSMAMTAYFLLQIAEEQKWLLLKKKSVSLLLIIMFVVFMAVLWEFHEFLMDQFFATHMQLSNFDTMKDLFLGMAGSFLAGIFLIFKKT